jgi:hypothetical protein
MLRVAETDIDSLWHDLVHVAVTEERLGPVSLKCSSRGHAEKRDCIYTICVYVSSGFVNRENTFAVLASLYAAVPDLDDRIVNVPYFRPDLFTELDLQGVTWSWTKESPN